MTLAARIATPQGMAFHTSTDAAPADGVPSIAMFFEVSERN